MKRHPSIFVEKPEMVCSQNLHTISRANSGDSTAIRDDGESRFFAGGDGMAIHAVAKILSIS